MPIEPVSAKYAVIVNALQARIEQGVYPAGELLPSEARLVREFGASRSTVVRALEFLRQQGWLTGVQGKGRIVLDRATPAMPLAPARVYGVLDIKEATEATLLRVRVVAAPTRIAKLLKTPEGAEAVVRVRTVAQSGSGPAGLTTVYIPIEVAHRAGLDKSAPVPDGLLRRLLRNGLVPHHVAEHLGARILAPREAALLAMPRPDGVVALVLVVRDQSGQPLLAVDAVFPNGHPLLRASFAVV